MLRPKGHEQNSDFLAKKQLVKEEWSRFAVTPTDATTYVDVSLLLKYFALIACYIAAGRAMMVLPVLALKNE
jgi:hypothetical protein